MQEIFLFKAKLILGGFLLSTLVFGSPISKILEGSQNNTEKRKLIYSANDDIIECPNSQLFDIEVKGSLRIEAYLSAVNKQCNIAMMSDKKAQELMKKIPNAMNIKHKNLTAVYDTLLKSYGMEYTYKKHFLRVVGAKRPTTVTKEEPTQTISLPVTKKIKYTVPKVYASLGRELEGLNQSCKVYQKLPLIDDAIKHKCKAYTKKVSKAFKVGYKLDPQADGDISEIKLNNYLKLLRSADENREKLTSFIASMIRKAKLKDDVDQYAQLIEAPHIHLSQNDYEFMNKHSTRMAKNPKYNRYLAHLEAQQEEEERERKRQKFEQEKQRLAINDQRKNCKKGHSESCIFIGKFYLNNNIQLANKFFNRACSLGNSLGCELLIATYKVNDNTENSRIADKMMKSGNYLDAYPISIDECYNKHTTNACNQLIRIVLSRVDAQTSERESYRIEKLMKRYSKKAKGLMLIQFGIESYNRDHKRSAKDYFKSACYYYGDAIGCKFYKILHLY